MQKHGEVQCWGQGEYGLPQNMLSNTFSPSKLVNLPPAKKVACGYNHACAVGKNGTILCWGFSNLGQVGNVRGFFLEPTPFPNFQQGHVIDAAVGSWHSCALVAGPYQNALQCWGTNSAGQVPASGPITLPKTTTQVFAGPRSTYVLDATTKSGTVWGV